MARMVLSHHLCDGKVNCLEENTWSSFHSFCLLYYVCLCITVLRCAKGTGKKSVSVCVCSVYHFVFIISILALSLIFHVKCVL